MELKRDEIISEIDTKIKFAKFANTDAVILSSKAAQFCLEYAQFYEQKIKELTEENERLRGFNSAKCEDCAGCTSWKCDCANIEADTVRKMQDKVRKKIKKTDWLSGRAVYLEIDRIAKEMLEDKK